MIEQSNSIVMEDVETHLDDDDFTRSAIPSASYTESNHFTTDLPLANVPRTAETSFQSGPGGQLILASQIQSMMPLAGLANQQAQQGQQGVSSHFGSNGNTPQPIQSVATPQPIPLLQQGGVAPSPTGFTFGSPTYYANSGSNSYQGNVIGSASQSLGQGFMNGNNATSVSQASQPTQSFPSQVVSSPNGYTFQNNVAQSMAVQPNSFSVTGNNQNLTGQFQAATQVNNPGSQTQEYQSGLNQYVPSVTQSIMAPVYQPVYQQPQGMTSQQQHQQPMQQQQTMQQQQQTMQPFHSLSQQGSQQVTAHPQSQGNLPSAPTNALTLYSPPPQLGIVSNNHMQQAPTQMINQTSSQTGQSTGQQGFQTDSSKIPQTYQQAPPAQTTQSTPTQSNNFNTGYVQQDSKQVQAQQQTPAPVQKTASFFQSDQTGPLVYTNNNAPQVTSQVSGTHAHAPETRGPVSQFNPSSQMMNYYAPPIAPDRSTSSFPLQEQSAQQTQQTQQPQQFQNTQPAQQVQQLQSQPQSFQEPKKVETAQIYQQPTAPQAQEKPAKKKRSQPDDQFGLESATSPEVEDRFPKENRNAADSPREGRRSEVHVKEKQVPQPSNAPTAWVTPEPTAFTMYAEPRALPNGQVPANYYPGYRAQPYQTENNRNSGSYQGVENMTVSPRSAIPQLYQHSPRSQVAAPVAYQTQPSFYQASINETADVVSTIQNEKTKSQQRRRKRAATQPSNRQAPIVQMILRNDSSSDDQGFQDRLTAFSSSPIQKFASVSTVSSRHIEKDRLTCIHSLGVLEGIDRKFACI